MRDFLTENIDRVLIDNPGITNQSSRTLSQISKRSNKIHLYTDSIPIFERYNIENQIEQTFQRAVPLPSGGAIVIDETEALIAIDVNTGSHRNKGNENDTIFQVNSEAAAEIASRYVFAI